MQRAAIFLGALRQRADEGLHRWGFRHADAYVIEFPKSGGTWVINLARDLLRSSGAVKDPTIVHEHRAYHPGLRLGFYVLRDGRDVVVSLYFQHVRDLQSPAGWRVSRADRYLGSVLGRGYDVDDVRGNLPTFIETLAKRPLGGLTQPRRDSVFRPWPEHIADWVTRPGVQVVRYENLLAQPVEELRRIQEHLNLSVGDAILAQVIERNSFRTITGRKPGVEDRSSFLRKGISGDWRTWFTRDAGEAFQQLGGEALICYRYEPDRHWIDGLPEH